MDPYVERIVQEIVAYLERNPQAADIAEGIERWWLRDTDIRLPALVAHALEILVARGDLEKVHTTRGVVFRRRGGAA
jgi:hypothetical protein